MSFTRTVLTLLGGLAAIVLTAVLISLILLELPIHDLSLLKWFPVLVVIIGYGLAGRITRRIPPVWLQLLLPGLLVIKALDFFYFPFMFVLWGLAALMIMVSRTELRKVWRWGSLIVCIAVFSYYLFSQPLIISNDRTGITPYGDVVNAHLLWGGDTKKELYIPDDSFSDIHQNTFSTADWKGKKVYISFWETSCGFCIAKQPALEKLKSEHRSDPNLLFVDISLDDNREKWENYLSRGTLSGLQLISRNPDRTKHLFGIDGLPKSVLIHPDGRYQLGLTLEGTRRLLRLNDDDLDRFMRYEEVIIPPEGE